jgi:tubulin delta
MLESVDFLDGIMIWQSLAGVTGSGLGSYITKIIKEEMPEVKILNTAILPNINGEVII